MCYRTAAVNEKADFPLAKWQADQLISRIIEDTNASDWKLYLTAGLNNFRYLVYPDYKANRRDQIKPKHLESLREHLVLDWDAELVDGFEADDAIGIDATSNTIIASIDKDLLQIPGKHFNFVKRQFIEVSEMDGLTQFYSQLLIGDSTDNIKGCPGIGKVNSERLYRGCENLSEFYSVCSRAYQDAYKDAWFKYLDLNAQLIYIWRIEGDNWQRTLNPLKDRPKQEVEVTSQSSPKIKSISTESTTEVTQGGFPPDGSSTATLGQ